LFHAGDTVDIGEVLVRTLQNTKYSVDEKLNQSFIQLFRGAASSTKSLNVEQMNEGNSSDQSEGEEGDDEEGEDITANNASANEVTEEREFQNGRMRRKVMFSKNFMKVRKSLFCPFIW
jgi:ribosome biogenesis protein BMS1